MKYKFEQDAKIDIDAALNGKEAIDKVIKDVESNDFEFCSYKLILMDCNMPFIDGFECTELIR